VLFLRRAGRLLAEHPEGVTLGVVELSRSLGLGARPDADDVGRNSPLRRTMDRPVRFRMAAWGDDDRLAVHTKVPALERDVESARPAPGGRGRREESPVAARLRPLGRTPGPRSVRR